MKPKKYAFTRADALALVDLVNSIETNGTGPVIKYLDKMIKQSGTKKGTWGFFAMRFKSLLLNKSDSIPFSIFAIGGNSKLPFVSFSTIPGATCPGALGNVLIFVIPLRLGATRLRSLDNCRTFIL